MQAVEGLEQVRFINASITSTHAAGIDDLGNLYIWGGIHGKPHLVEASKAFTSARVVCAEDLSMCALEEAMFIYLGSWGRESNLDVGG